MKKAGIFFGLVLGLIAVSSNVIRTTNVPVRKVEHTKQLCYSIETDSQSPAEIKLITFSSSAGTATTPGFKSVSGIAQHFLNRISFKQQSVQYPLYIKERIWSPVFLRNNCLRI